MKPITISTLELKNFKGIRSLKIDFDSVTNISGENATGKTTIADAFRWLLFDKDSTDRKDFSIKTFDAKGNVIHGLDHTVTAIISVDGRTKVLSKTYKEKWQKKRGEADQMFTGHETIYSIDDIPMKKGDYQEEVNNILEEELFKLVTDPLYFSQKLHWEQRRKILSNMIDSVTVDDIIASEPSLAGIKDLLFDHSPEELRKSFAAKKKKLNDEIKTIPIRIDEASNSIVDVDVIDTKVELADVTKKIQDAEELITDLSKPDPSITAKWNELADVRNHIAKIEDEVKESRFNESRKIMNVLTNLERERDAKADVRSSLVALIERSSKRAGQLKTDIEDYGNKWDSVKVREFKIDDSFECPTCKRKLDPDVIESKVKELAENFNTQKAKDLANITELGKSARNELDSIEQTITDDSKRLIEAENRIEVLIAEIVKAKKNLDDFNNTDPVYPDVYTELQEQAKSLVDELNKPVNEVDTSEIRARKVSLQAKADELKSTLHKAENNQTLRDRISELETQERDLSQKLADLEKTEFLLEKFTQLEAELIETKVNSIFSYVNFKMFDVQINGGIQPTCEALIDGVPFSDANTGAKINAGVDIINALSSYYKVSAPIIVDNAESIVNLLPTESQLIRLIVSAEDKTLRVEYADKKYAEVS